MSYLRMRKVLTLLPKMCVRKLRWHALAQTEHLRPFRAGVVGLSHHECCSPGHSLGGLWLGEHMHSTDVEWGPWPGPGAGTLHCTCA